MRDLDDIQHSQKKAIVNPSGSGALLTAIEKIACLIFSLVKGLSNHVVFSAERILPT